MKKAAQKTTAPLSLGTKRNCPKCGTKFYDFNKDEPICPKCETKLDPTAVASPAPPRLQPEPKKVTKADKEAGEEAVLATTEEVALDDADGFESVEDLDDEDEDIVEDIDVDDEENESY